jgi:hypothetical protein
VAKSSPRHSSIITSEPLTTTKIPCSVSLALVLSLLLAISNYGLIMKDNNSVNIAGMFVALCLSAILPMQFISMNSVKTELKSRNAKN